MNEFKTAQKVVDKKRHESSGRCLFCKDVFELPKTKIKDLYEALLDEDITAQTIVDVLASWNVYASKTSVQNHRRGYRGYESHLNNIKRIITK